MMTLASPVAAAWSRYGILARLPVRRDFTVVVSFEDGWWKADVRELPGVEAHVSDHRDAEAAAREAIGYALGADPGSFGVDLVIRPRRARGALSDAS